MCLACFRLSIVKVAVNPRQPSGFTDYLDNVMTKFVINNRTNAWKTDVNLFFTINCPLSPVDASHKV